MLLTMFGSIVIAILGLVLVWACGRWGKRRRSRIGRVAAAAVVIADVPVLVFSAYLIGCLLGGQRDEVEFPLDGMTYRRHVLDGQQRAVVQVVRIDGVRNRRFVVTPPVQTGEGLRNLACFSTDAIGALGAKVVINANFFTPFRDRWVFDAYPTPGDPVEPIGPVVSGGVRYGRPKPGWPSFWQANDGRIGFGELPGDAESAVTGRQFVVRDGVPAVVRDEPPYPRTAIAGDSATDRVWLVVVDGKQPRYSDGLSLSGLADFLIGLGATEAIELDGGGSAVLAFDTHDGAMVVNRPCHTKVPGRQRPVGVFLGVEWADGR